MAGSSSATWQLGVSKKELNFSQPLGLTLSLIPLFPIQAAQMGLLPPAV